MASSSYTVAAHRYAKAVVSGKIAAGKWVRLACQRHLEDLGRFKSKDSPYKFNPKLRDRAGKPFSPADNLCGFIERLPHIKGPIAGQLIELEPW
jgi:phage terminase large subunit-like protein